MFAQVGGTTAPEWAPLELAERGLPGEQLHGLVSGLLHIHLYLTPVRCATSAPACASGDPGAGEGSCADHPALPGSPPRPAQRAGCAPENGAPAAGHARAVLGSDLSEGSGSSGEGTGSQRSGAASSAPSGTGSAAELVQPAAGDAATKPGAGAGEHEASRPEQLPREGEAQTSGIGPPAPFAAACCGAAPRGTPPGSELAAAACVDLEWLQALPEGPAGGLAALDDAQPLPPNTLVLELSDGLYVHPRLALRPLPPHPSGPPLPGGAHEAPVRLRWLTVTRPGSRAAESQRPQEQVHALGRLPSVRSHVGADAMTSCAAQGVRNRVLQSFLRRPLFTPHSAGEEAAPRSGR